MSKFIGRKIAIGLGNETSRLTGVSPSHWLPQSAFDFQEQAEIVRAQSAINRIADSEEKVTTEKWAEGNIEGEIRAASFGLILKALAGADPSTTGSDPYTHDFTLQNDNQHGTITITVQDPIGDQMFEGAMINSLSLDQGLTDFASFSAGFISKYPIPTSHTPSFASEGKFTKKDLTVKLADSLGGLSGASRLNIESLSLDIEKNVVRDSVFGTPEPIDFLNTNLSVEGEFTLKYEDRTYRNYIFNDTTKSMLVEWENSDGDKLSIKLPLVDFFDWGPDYSLDDVVKQTIPFKANYDLANGNDIISTLELINSTSSY